LECSLDNRQRKFIGLYRLEEPQLREWGEAFTSKPSLVSVTKYQALHDVFTDAFPGIAVCTTGMHAGEQIT
jgi:hypothetical protein